MQNSLTIYLWRATKQVSIDKSIIWKLSIPGWSFQIYICWITGTLTKYRFSGLGFVDLPLEKASCNPFWVPRGFSSNFIRSLLSTRGEGTYLISCRIELFKYPYWQSCRFLLTQKKKIQNVLEEEIWCGQKQNIGMRWKFSQTTQTTIIINGNKPH